MSSKRKAAPVPAMALDDVESPIPKRRKFADTVEETPEGTTKTGLTFLEQLKNTRDKADWPIATHFLSLPDRKKIPEYYERIGLPMALDVIEGKLKAHEYPSMTSLEGDLRRMIRNAKSFNEKRSQIFSDSEKVRKVLSKFMEEHNPAYRSSDYTAYTTPVPPEWQEKIQEQKVAQEQNAQIKDDREEEEEEKPTGRRTRLVTHVGSSSAANNRRASSTPAVQDAEGAYESFEGNTFQQAQEKMITEMINYKDDSDQLIFTPFIHLPSRTLVDYYKIIRHPVSLKSTQKLVRGIKGREPPTGTTFLKSWQAFEEEVGYIWQNARTYNEDGSDISELAGELEEYFHTRLAEAKRTVQEPPQPRVKLRMPAKSPEPSKITLKFGGQKPSGPVAMSVDNEALKRQQDLVRAGANGHTGPARLPQERSDSTEHPMNGLKVEATHGQSPAPSVIQMNGANEARQSPSAANLHMPPPMNLSSRLPSGSPHPQSLASGAGPTGHAVATPFNTRFRQPDKDTSDALINNLNIATHHGLNVTDHFSLNIPASATRTQQSVALTLPFTHYFLRITPTVSSSLMHRPSKTVVSCGTTRLHQIPQTGEPDIRRPIYETRVVPGVNTIEVEVIAGPPRGAPKVGSGQEIEFEKFTVFVHLQKT
ncbi:hypothetical protein ABVK25_001861 [Lepraria finkii]|uniref:Bromo domain-containing protein n=1 Tax=Lepraria finkii TaxID=1340010 RepID=A0ABR4BKB0_9LECA